MLWIYHASSLQILGSDTQPGCLSPLGPTPGTALSALSHRVQPPWRTAQVPGRILCNKWLHVGTGDDEQRGG